MIKLKREKEEEYLRGRSWDDLDPEEREHIQAILDKIDWEIKRFNIL